MFNFGNKNDSLTIIAKGTRFEGNLNSDHGVFVEGTLITAKLEAKSVQVGVGGQLQLSDKLVCEYLEVSGTVEGNVKTTSLKVNKGAYIRGDITYETIEVKEGGIIRGNLNHNALPSGDIVND